MDDRDFITLQELTEADAAGGVLTFAMPIEALRFDALDDIQSTLVVNGITLTVPGNLIFEERVGGTRSASVTVTGSASYICQRLEAL